MLDVEVWKNNRCYTSNAVNSIERSKSGEKRLDIVIAHVSVSIRVRYFHPFNSPILYVSLGRRQAVSHW